MHRDGASTADGGKMTTMHFFPTMPNPISAICSPMTDFATKFPYSSIFFPSSTSDHQNPTAKATASLPAPTGKPTLTTATEDLSILMLQHQALLSRHKNCISHLEKTFKEAETLRQENTNLRVANTGLNNRLNLIVRAYLQNNYASMMSSGSSSPSADHLGSPDPISSSIEKIGCLRIGEENIGAGRWEGCESPTSVLGTDLVENDADRVSMPKSISVRSKGFLKAGQAGATLAGTSNVPPKCAANRTQSLNPVDGPQKVYVRAKNKKGEPIELEVYNQGTSKTELCNKWQETGTCPYGENCQFAHGIEELRPVLRHPRYKTEVCRMVLAGDHCPYGHRCHFRHALNEQEKLIAPLLKQD